MEPCTLILMWPHELKNITNEVAARGTVYIMCFTLVTFEKNSDFSIRIASHLFIIKMHLQIITVSAKSECVGFQE